MKLFVLLMLCSWQMLMASGGKILLLPAVANSHIAYFGFLGKELSTIGHTIHMLHSPGLPTPNIVKESNITVYNYKIFHPEMADTDPEMEVEMMRLFLQNPIDTVLASRTFQEEYKSFCTNPLEDDDLFLELEANQYDFAILDPFVISRCLAILLYRLNIPFATLITQYEPMLFGIPALPSFVPFAMRMSYTEHMTFWQRLLNLVYTIEWSVSPRLFHVRDSLITTYAPEKPPISMNELVRQSRLWLLNTDDAIDYPRPSMPHIVNIGGLTTKPAGKLPKKFESFLDDASQGAILVSFGSILKSVPPEIGEKLLTAFGHIKQKVIWRYNGTKLENIPKNVMISKWIPQNDILGHANVKLFITHGGNNGQFEALYHGVPMIVFPIFGEQAYNGNRIKYKGYGLTMSLYHMTPEELERNIEEVLENPSYTEKIQLGSRIYHSAPMTARERAVHWIEHVMKYGGDHLRSSSLNMAWYKYWMLDILVFLLTVFFVIVFVFLKLTVYTCMLLFGRNLRKKKTE